MYHNIKDHYRMKFYRLPKVFFTNEKYKHMSASTKIAWAILADRMSISIKNNWYDEDGNIYFLYSRDKLSEILNLNKSTVTTVTKELVNLELLQKKRLGQGRSDRLYLMQPEVNENDIYEIDNHENPETLEPVEKLENPTSKNRIFQLQEVGKSAPSKTDLSDLELELELEEEEKEININTLVSENDSYKKLTLYLREKEISLIRIQSIIMHLHKSKITKFTQIDMELQYQHMVDERSKGKSIYNYALYFANGLIDRTEQDISSKKHQQDKREMEKKKQKDKERKMERPRHNWLES